MTPREYLQLVVKPNIDDFNADVSDARKAYNAIATADALAAHIYYWCTKNAPHEVVGLKDDNKYRTHMKKSRANLELLHDVAKALKHVELTKSKSKVKTAREARPRAFGYGEGVYGVGSFSGGEQVSVIIDGHKVQLEWTLKTAVEFYEKEMDRLGIL